MIDDLADRGKARDSKSNRRKCNPKAECRLIGGPDEACEAVIWLAEKAPLEKNTAGFARRFDEPYATRQRVTP